MSVLLQFWYSFLIFSRNIHYSSILFGWIYRPVTIFQWRVFWRHTFFVKTWYTKIKDRVRFYGFLYGSFASQVLGTLRSNSGDVHETYAEKQTLHQFKLFRVYPNSPCYLKEGDFGLSWREGNALKFVQSITDGRIYRLAFPVPK